MSSNQTEVLDRIPAIRALAPQAIPRASALIAWVAQELQSGSLGLGLASDVEALRRLAAETPATPANDDAAVHDEFFCVERTQGKAEPIFLKTILLARAILLEESAASQIHSQSRRMDGCLRALLDAIGMPTATDEPGAVAFQPANEALFRWIRGHQIFVALTQGAIVAFEALGQAIRSGSRTDTAKWADLATTLLDGSIASFEFTGEFSVERYETDIRPMMMVPNVKVNLSGLMSGDHRWLVKQLRDMKPSLMALYEREAERHGRMASTLAAVYDSHVHVCERFVGAKSSLLTDGKTEKSGPELIEQFKGVRLKPFEHGGRAERHQNRIAVEAESPPGGAACPFGGVRNANKERN